MPAVAAERILKELAALWSNMASPAGGTATESGVLRACAMTFIVALEPGDDPQHIAEMIAELMHEHPSRAIVLIPDAQGAVLDARVSAQCWMPFGKREQVCCEQIEVSTPLNDAVQAARLILGLLAPDLPVLMWCRGPSWLKAPGFDDLLPRTTKVIIDTLHGCRMDAIVRLRQKAPHVADLAWTRTTPTRQSVSRFFDDPKNAARIKDLNTIVAPHDQTYLAAWLLRSLPARRLAMDGPEGLLRLEGPGVAFEFPILPGPESEYLLIGEELGIPGADPVFEATLPVAESLA